MTEILEAMTRPDSNGTPSLPKRGGPKGLLPSTWLERTLRLEYVDGFGACARKERYESLTVFLLQECHLRRRHPDNSAGYANLEGGLDSDTYADLANRKCIPPSRHPTEEGNAKRGAHATR
jgi:hypothetical protein